MGREGGVQPEFPQLLSLAYLCLSSWVLCLCLGSVTVMQMRDFMLLASPENTCGRTHGRLGLVDSACPACTKPWAPSSALHELSLTVHDCQPAAHEVEAGGSGFHHHPWLQQGVQGQHELLSQNNNKHARQDQTSPFLNSWPLLTTLPRPEQSLNWALL